MAEYNHLIAKVEYPLVSQEQLGAAVDLLMEEEDE